MINEATDKSNMATMHRVYSMLALLKTDFAYGLTDKNRILAVIEKQHGKQSNYYKAAKAQFEAFAYGRDQINVILHKLDQVIGDRETIAFLKKDSSSERMANLHEFWDKAIAIQNVEVLNEMIELAKK